MKKNNLFKVFSAKNEETEKSVIVYTDFKGFFISLGRKFWNLSNLNLLYTLCNFPIFFFLYTLTGKLDSQIQTVANPLYPAYFGMKTIAENQVIASLAPSLETFANMSLPTTATRVFQCISLLAIFTFGLSNAGMAYVIRGYNRGEPIFMISEFFGAIKRNIRQALVMGVLDIAFTALLIWDVIFWSAQEGYVNGLFFYFSLFLVILYFIMRFYIYTLMITFKLSIFKIFKNAFIFAFLGIKRNIVGLLGVAAVIFLNYIILKYLMPVGIVLPAIITTSICFFITGYTSYPVIKQYMIDPYYTDEQHEDDGGEESVFVDRG